MKKFVFLIPVFCLLAFDSLAGVIEIPEAIKRSFEQKFPTAQSAKWDGDSESHYEVGFVLNGKENIAVFLPDGSFKEIETEMNSSELPKRIINAINKKFPLAKIPFVLKVQRSNNTTVYELEVDTGIEEIDVTFDEMGYEVD